ncbi:L-lactate dehydrogenase [Cephus cinctus]|uniref:L-lactate dehydrogenase n=1 Tax=Cephus cinctus TaxID=211228 RepID=A0AAJ7C0I1_CEPCN|nr:L-lactate dehydrogenase [Cephus cinctus]XP_015598304.1 L-lactate dehydrogenase [Cephus cinctus]XP_024942216.1 L-lactate dehydrogenase [Cephus cinctus]
MDDEIVDDGTKKVKDDIKPKEESECLDGDKIPITTTTTKNALITTQLGPCDTYPHRVKVSIVGTGNVGMACAIAILMRRMASEVCLIDKDLKKAMAEAEDIQHAGIFLGNPLVTGASDMSMVKESAVVIIAIADTKSDGKPDVKYNFEVFKKLVPTIAKFACRAVILVATHPIDVMSYIAWKLSKFPSNRVLGTGTLVDSARFQYFLSQKFGLANTSVSCMSIGAQGDSSVPLWSSVHVAGMKLRDINPRMGEKDDPEKWNEINAAVNESEARLDKQKGSKAPNCWGLGFCTAEIVDAVLRNTKVILPASTYIHSCSHGTDKDVYMSVPCVLGREGVHHTVRQKLTEAEKTALQSCADNIRNTLRECGILKEPRDDVKT